MSVMSTTLRYSNNAISLTPATLLSLGFPVDVRHVTAAGDIDFRSGPTSARARTVDVANLLVSVTNGIINRSWLCGEARDL